MEDKLATEKQIKYMYVLFNKLGLSESAIAKRKSKIHERFGVMSTMRLQTRQIGIVIDELKAEVEELERSKQSLF
jgi:hypothetical protein